MFKLGCRFVDGTLQSRKSIGMFNWRPATLALCLMVALASRNSLLGQSRIPNPLRPQVQVQQPPVTQVSYLQPTSPNHAPNLIPPPPAQPTGTGPQESSTPSSTNQSPTYLLTDEHLAEAEFDIPFEAETREPQEPIQIHQHSFRQQPRKPHRNLPTDYDQRVINSGFQIQETLPPPGERHVEPVLSAGGSNQCGCRNKYVECGNPRSYCKLPGHNCCSPSCSNAFRCCADCRSCSNSRCFFSDRYLQRWAEGMNTPPLVKLTSALFFGKQVRRWDIDRRNWNCRYRFDRHW